MQDYVEKRRHERVAARLSIYVEVVARQGTEGSNPIFRTESVDVSRGGLRLWSPQEIPAGRRLHLAIPLDDWTDNLELEGRAVWACEAGDRPGYWIGLQLEDAGREAMEKWFTVVHRLQA